MTAGHPIDRRRLTWLAVLLLPIVLLFSGTRSEYALPVTTQPGNLTTVPQAGQIEGITQIAQWIEQIPYARIVFPALLILSVWLMSIIIVYGRARYIARKERKAEARLFDELVHRSRVGYLAVDDTGKIASTNPAFESMLGSKGWAGADLAETGISMGELVPGDVVVVKLKSADGGHVSALASAMPGDEETHMQVIITPLLDEGQGEGQDQARKEGGDAGDAVAAPPVRRTRNQSLLRNINHELRTPLTIILGSATLLESDVSEENADLVDAIRVGGERLLRILETLVLLSELEAGDEESQAGSVELVRVLNEIVARRWPDAKAKGLEFVVDLPASPVHVNGDERGVEHICSQLIDNALKFTDAGRIVVGCEVDETEAHVTIVDTGRGMDAAALETVLADFRDRRQSRRSTGSIGLSLARLLADEMGGRLELESTPGAGTKAVATFVRSNNHGVETDVERAA